MKYINRKELHTQLKKKLQKPFIYAYGVEESGKSTAIRSFLKNDKQINYQWLKLKEENTTDDIWIKIFLKLKAYFQLPEEMLELSKWKNVSAGYNSYFARGDGLFVLVLQGGSTSQASELLEIFSRILTKKGCKLRIIFISTKAPDKKIQKFIQNGSCSLISQKSFLFSPLEVETFYRIDKQGFDERDIAACMSISGGWVAMMNKVEIKQMPKVPINGIRELMDTILSENFSPKQLVSLIKISFLNAFELDQVYYLTKDKGLTVKILSLAEGNLIFQEGEGYEIFRILPPFRKQLLQKLNSSRINCDDLHQMHMQWLVLKERYLEALEFAYEISAFDFILMILDKYPDSMYYDLKPELMKRIYDSIPTELLMKHIYVYMQVMEDYLLMINPQKGMEMLMAISEDIANRPDNEANQALRGEVELVLGYSTYNNLYDMCAHFKKAYHLLYPKMSRLSKPDMVISFGSPHVLYQYLTKAGDSEKLITFMEDEIQYYAGVTQGLNTAIEIQARAELELELGHYANARMLAEKAYQKAFTKNIRYMCVCSMFTIGRVSILTHDEYNFNRVIHLLKKQAENNINMILEHEIESALAYLLSLQSEEHHCIEDLFDTDIEMEVMDIAHHSFSYIAQGQIFINNGKYDKLYTLSQKMREHYEYQEHIFGNIYTYLYKAIALYQMGKEKEALEQMKIAIKFGSKDYIITPFVEQRGDIVEMLQKLHQSKQVVKIQKEIQAYLQYKVFHFSEKEKQVFLLQKKGYSRTAIAEEMGLTIYAVKYYLQNIKKKTNSRKIASPMDEE